MSTTDDTFEKLYSRIMSLVGQKSDQDSGAGPHPDNSIPDCVEDLEAQGHTESEAHAICTAAMKAGLSGEEKEEVLETAKAAAVDGEHLGAVFSGVLQKAGYEFEPPALVEPGQKAGEDLMQQSREVMARGHDRGTSLVIAEATLKAGLSRDHRDELLATAKEVSDYDAQVPVAYKHLIDYASVDVKGEDDLELPKVCRKCEQETRMKGNFMCPDCHPDVDAKEDEYELVKSAVQDGEDEGGAAEKSGDEPPGETRKVYLDHGIQNAPPDATVRVDDKGLYYEEPVDGTDQKASVPDNAVSISDRSEAPEDAQIVTGERGGLYYLPADGEDEEMDGPSGAENQIAVEDLPLAPEYLQEGAIMNNPLPSGPERVEVDSVEADEVTFTHPETGDLVGQAVTNPNGGSEGESGGGGEEGGEEGSEEAGGPDLTLSDDLFSPFEADTDTTEVVNKNRESMVSWVADEHGDEVASEVEEVFDTWTEDGYESEEAAPVWAAAASFAGTDPPEDFAETADEVDSDVATALTEVMEQTQEALREKFGDSLTAHRGFDYYEMEEYADIGEDGVEIEPQPLESWTLDETTAERYGTHAVEMEIDIEEVGFYSGFFMTENEEGQDVHETMNEVTLSRSDAYSFGPEDVIDGPDPSIDPLFGEKADGGRMPLEDSNWLWRLNFSEEATDQKADPMANGHDLDPETGKGTCETTGKEIEAETMKELTDDCPHCGEPLSVLE